jgi:hypothetical protein
VGDERYADIVLRCLDSSVTDKDNCLCAVRALFEGHVDINPLLVLFEARSPLQAGQVLEINPLPRGAFRSATVPFPSLSIDEAVAAVSIIVQALCLQTPRYTQTSSANLFMCLSNALVRAPSSRLAQIEAVGLYWRAAGSTS